MVDVYINLILRGEKKLEQVPESLYAEVRVKIIPEAVRRITVGVMTEMELLELKENGNISEEVYDEIFNQLYGPVGK